MKTVIVLCGIPGSGKSTLAGHIVKLAKNKSVKVISSDKIREEINGHEASQDNPQLVWKRFYDDAFESILENDITLLDATFAKRRDRTLVHKLFGIEGVRLICIHLNPPFLKASTQNEKRERVVPHFVLENMYYSLEQFPPSETDGFETVIELKSSQEIFTKWNVI